MQAKILQILDADKNIAGWDFEYECCQWFIEEWTEDFPSLMHEIFCSSITVRENLKNHSKWKIHLEFSYDHDDGSNMSEHDFKKRQTLIPRVENHMI